MLDSFRTLAQSKYAKVVLAFIMLPFAFVGVESYIGANSAQDKVASVGKKNITVVEFNQAVQGQLERFRQQFGTNIDASILDNPEMRRSILDSLIDRDVVGEAVRTTKIMVSDNALREKISLDPNFQEGGVFSPNLYDGILKAQGYSPTTFENLLREDLKRQHFIESVTNTSLFSTASLQQQLNATEQTREVAIINFSPDQYQAQIKIAPEQVKAYYESHKADYTIPQQVRMEYVELSVDTIAPQIQISADELKNYYDKNNSRYMQQEERKASHILINAGKSASDTEKAAAKTKADALYAEVKKNPVSFVEVAKKNSQDPGSAVNGGDLGFFKRGAMVKPFEDATFSAKKGDIVGPVLSDFGYHIILLSDIRPAKGKSLVEVTPEIEGELKKQKAQQSFAELAEKFSDAVYEQSNSLKAASDLVKAPVRQSPFMSKSAALPPFNNPKLLAAMFSDDVMKNKRNTEAIETAANTLVAARLLEEKPAILRLLAEVEKEISSKLLNEEANKRAVQAGEAALKQLQAAQPIEQKWPAMLAVSRANTGGLSPDVISTAMRTNAKKLPAFSGVKNGANGYTLVQVAKVIDPATADAEKLKAGKERLAQAVTQQETLALLQALRGKTSISIDESKLLKKLE